MNKVILHLTSLEKGGAAQFTFDYHRQMLAEGYESYVAVRGHKCLFPDGTWHSINHSSNKWERFKRYLFRKRISNIEINKQYSVFNLCERFTCHSAQDTLAVLPHNPDVVYVHWVSDYANAKFLADIKASTQAQIVLIMIDHALLTGGCHYPGLCDRYKHGCINCPMSKSLLIQDVVRKNMIFKQQYLPKDCVIYANTSDDVTNISQSTLYKNFKIEQHIARVDSDRYKPVDNKELLRKKWNVPIDKKIVFFGSSHLDEPRKGMQVLFDALDKVSSQNVFYVVAGGKQLPCNKENLKNVGFLNESQLIEIYQLADVFVCPSLADAGPLMVNQSLMCGLPVVAFPVGISIDLVRTGVTGYLAKYNDSQDLSKGIDFIVSLNNDHYYRMSNNCRKQGLQLYAI